MARKKRLNGAISNGRKESNGTRVLDPEKLNAFMHERSLSREKIAEMLGVSVHTMERLLSGQPVRPRTVLLVAARLAVPVAELLIGDDQGGTALLAHSEWEVIEEVSAWMQVSPGIRRRIHRLRHRFLPETFARCKCYELRNLASRNETEIREYLLRHPKVLRRLRTSPFFPANHGVFGESGGTTWWVIDEWVAGHPLQAALNLGPLAHKNRTALFVQLAEAIQELHRHVIICRSLTPANIVIRESDSSIVLTDLELCKLSDGSPTVKNQLQRDSPYLAPEATSFEGNPELTTDVYSWGRIFVHAACGTVPDRGREVALLERAGVPQAQKALVMKCVAFDRRERPKSMDEILTVMTQSH